MEDIPAIDDYQDIEVKDILDDKLEKYAAVKSDELSDSKNRKYVIIDRKQRRFWMIIIMRVT